MVDFSISVLSIILHCTTFGRRECHGPVDLEGPPGLFVMPSHGVWKPQGQEEMPIKAYTHILIHSPITQDPRFLYSNIPGNNVMQSMAQPKA